MDTLTAARVQMEVSLAFHMVFAAVGMAMPLMMLIAEWRWLRYRDEDGLRMARTWAKVTAVLFAIGVKDFNPPGELRRTPSCSSPRRIDRK